MSERFRERQVLDPQSGEWMDADAPEEGAPEDELERGRYYLARGAVLRARGLLKRWVAQNPDSERYLEGVYLHGEALFQAKLFYQAYEQFEIVADQGSGEIFDRAIRRAMDCARAFFAGEKRRVFRIFWLPAYDDGAQILGRVYERLPGTRIGEEALKTRADFRFERGEMDLAQDEYANLVREFPKGRYTQFAMLRSAEAAEAAFPGILFDDRPLLNAEERYRQVEETYPLYADRERVAARLDGIRQVRAEKDLEIGKWYERTRQPQAAAFYYRVILKDYGNTLAAAEARQRLRALGFEDESATTEAP